MKRHTVSTIFFLVGALIILLAAGAHFDLAPEHRHLAPLADAWVGFFGILIGAVARYLELRPRKR